MKKIILIITVIGCVFKLSAQSGKKIETNIRIIHRFFNALNNHDTTILTKFCDDSVHLESPNREGTKTGEPALVTVYARYFKSDPYLKYTITNILARNEAVVAEYVSSGQMTNAEANIPAYMKGKKYSLKNCTRFNVKKSKITSIVTYFDQVSFLKQMGFFEQKN